jgi:GT2 family glycosyltransferase
MLGLLERQYAHLRILPVDGMNRGQALNEAVDRAGGELLLFTESHCLAYPEWVADYLRLFEQDRVQVANGSIQVAPSDSWSSRCEKAQHDSRDRRFSALGIADSYLDFHNTGIRRRCFERIGGLSTDLPQIAEFELGARLHQAGNEIVRFERSTVYHFNNSRAWDYARGVLAHGRDRTRLLATRERAFSRRYFPSRRFQKLLPVARFLRAPLIGVTASLFGLSFAGFEAARLLGSYQAARLFFHGVSEHSHQLGQILALADDAKRG